MRGVPRLREATSTAPSSVSVGVEQAGAAADDLLQVGGLVELQVRGEAEPVAQRPGQQPGPGGRADEGERREVERDRGGAGPLADDDVDAEVLHRHVEHLLGRPRHPVDLVDEEHVALVEPGQDRGEVAGVGDRRTAGDAQRRGHLGGDDHRQRGLAEPGRPAEQHVVGGPAARSGRLQHERELLAHPVLADHLVEGPRPQRRLEGALVVVDLGVDEAAAGQVRRPRRRSAGPRRAPGVTPCSARAGRRAAAPRRRRRLVVAGGDLVEGACRPP